MRVTLLILLLAPAYANSVDKDSYSESANPIRKVVRMLQIMQKKIEAEGAAADKLFEKFECYCKNAGDQIAISIGGSETKPGQLTNAIAEAQARLALLKEELKKAQEDLEAARAAIAEGLAVREKQAAEFAKIKAESIANINAVAQAIEALKKGMTGFLQTAAAQYLRNLVVNSPALNDSDRDEVVSFISGEQGEDYTPQSGEILGILKQMKDTMMKALAEAQASEDAAIKAFIELKAAKMKEISALIQSIQSKTVAIGELAVQITQMQADLSDTEKSVMEDKKFLADLEKNCKEKREEHQESMKLRAEERLALADTIKILNDDDALDLFKKASFPSASSLLQMKVSASAVRKLALAHITDAWRNSPMHRPQLDFIALAIQGKKVSFSKVVTMIDEMVTLLGKEQQADKNKKEYCKPQIEMTEDKKKELTHAVGALEAKIESLDDAVESLTAEMKALSEGIVALDKSVEAATDQRKEEHENFAKTLATDAAAKELLEFAKNRLNKFYNPSQYKASAAFAQISKHSFAQASTHQHGKSLRAPRAASLVQTYVSPPIPDDERVYVGGDPAVWGPGNQPKCPGVVCPEDLCPDGLERRKIGDDCCACPVVGLDCSNVMCSRDLCPDGSGRRQIGNDCCACPATNTTMGDCSNVMCSADVCPADGKSRRQIGDKCCACPPMPTTDPTAAPEPVEPPPPPPEVAKAYKRKGKEGNGVIAMIDTLISDLMGEVREAKNAEKLSQFEYDQMVKDAQEKRATDTATLTVKQEAKATAEADSNAAKDELSENKKELMATDGYLASLHAECDWLLKYYDVRKEAREGEVESLNKAKAVLSGADYSLLQTNDDLRHSQRVL